MVCGELCHWPWAPGGRTTTFFVFFVSLVYTTCLYPLFKKADELSHVAIGAAIEVHRLKGPGLIESIHERCLMRELDLRKIAAVSSWMASCG
jgi:hypothetical protein